MLDWHLVPPGVDGAELQHDYLDARWFPRSGRVLVWDEDRSKPTDTPLGRVQMGGRWVEARELASTMAMATTLATGLTIELSMREDARREIEMRERDRQRGFSRDRTSDRDEVRELRRRLDDPARVVHLLGIEKGARRQPNGLIVTCPAHADRTPSCSIRVARDGTLSCVCMACGWRGDVLGLIAAAHKLDARRDFRRVLSIAAGLAGVELRGAA